MEIWRCTVQCTMYRIEMPLLLSKSRIRFYLNSLRSHSSWVTFIWDYKQINVWFNLCEAYFCWNSAARLITIILGFVLPSVSPLWIFNLFYLSRSDGRSSSGGKWKGISFSICRVGSPKQEVKANFSTGTQQKKKKRLNLFKNWNLK